jgi:hypothetical protein
MVVQQGVGQRGVGAGQDGQVLVALVGGFAAARVDAHQPGALAFGLLRVAPEVQVAANGVAAPDEDERDSAKCSTRMPTLAPRVYSSPAAPAEAQMVRSSKEAPSR